eukprot:COSAG02_NODE_19313_length_889_cov_0.839241_1_plen_54_part_10
MSSSGESDLVFQCNCCHTCTRSFIHSAIERANYEPITPGIRPGHKALMPGVTPR